MAAATEPYFTNYTPHDLVLYHEDNTTRTIPKSGRVLSVSSTQKPRLTELYSGFPVYDVPPNDMLLGAFLSELAGKHIIVSTMTAEYLATQDKGKFAVYAPSTRREDQVRDEKGAILGIRALQRYC
jgi:hypothetical protein